MLTLHDERVPRGIRVDQLCKHVFVSGMPGGGKTTSLISLLIQLFARGIRFLVIESAKTEYRLLKGLHDCPEPSAKALSEALEVYTPGVDLLSPLRFNPLWRPPGIEAEEHIDLVLRCFRASMPMFEPLPALLDESLMLVYERHPHPDDPPTMDDLAEAAREILSCKPYSPELKSDLLGALEVRLGMLTRRRVGRLLRSSTCAPNIAQLMASFSIVELDPLESDVKCLLALLLLSSIHQHIRLHPQKAGASDPRFVIVIEEAHNIVGRSPDAAIGTNQTDPKLHATELICHMLAEFRALGIGLVIADQSPSQVAPEVIKNTSTKLVFRHVASEDRQTLADAMLFGDVEFEEIARLLPGEAYLFAEGYHRAHRIRTPNLAESLRLPRPPDAGQLLSLLRGQPWFQMAAMRRAGDTLLRLETAVHQYERQRQSALEELKALFQRQVSLARIREAGERLKASRDTATLVRAVGEKIGNLSRALERGPLAEAQSIPELDGDQGARLANSQARLLRRFDEEIRPQAERLKAFIDRRVAQLKDGVF